MALFWAGYLVGLGTALFATTIGLLLGKRRYENKWDEVIKAIENENQKGNDNHPSDG